MLKRLLLALLFISLAAPNFSCTAIIDSVSEEEPSDERDNPNDPQSPDAVLPDIQLTGGFNLNQTFTVSTNTLNLNWETTGTGITEGLQYRYKLAAPGETLGSISYSAYSNTTSATFNVFETLGSDVYNFEIEVSSNVNTGLSPKVFTGSFRVDAFQEETFLFLPNQIGDNGDGTYTASIFLDEVEASDEIVAYRLDIIYDIDQLLVNTSDISVYEDTRSLFYRGNAQFITFTEVIGDTIRIESGVAGEFAAVSGSGAIGEIIFRLSGGSTSSSIRVSPTSVLKTKDGQDVAIADFVSAEINQTF
jgi:hypothetical protein